MRLISTAPDDTPMAAIRALAPESGRTVIGPRTAGPLSAQAVGRQWPSSRSFAASCRLPKSRHWNHGLERSRCWTLATVRNPKSDCDELPFIQLIAHLLRKQRLAAAPSALEDDRGRLAGMRCSHWTNLAHWRLHHSGAARANRDSGMIFVRPRRPRL